MINDTEYKQEFDKEEEPVFSGDDNYFDIEDRKFNKLCAFMTTQLKIPNISKLSVIEFYGLYEQIMLMNKE